MSTQRPAESLPAAEVADVLRSVLRGERTLYADHCTWPEQYCNNWHCHTNDGWHLVIFDDCDELDYIDEAKSPDGRWCDYAGWIDGGLTDGGEHGREGRQRELAIDPTPKRRWWAPWSERACGGAR